MVCYPHLAIMMLLSLVFCFVLTAGTRMEQSFEREKTMSKDDTNNAFYYGNKCSGTQCRNAVGTEGCCSFENAECCSDGLHCCPNGFHCNEAGTCTKKEVVAIVSMMRKDKLKFDVQDEICPDGTSSCPDLNTCCKLSVGGYGCCPLQNAVCCSDHIHCCPHGYTCNVGSGTCSLNSLVTPFLPVIETKPIEEKSVICPGGTSSCPDSNTCCALASGGYGCCPLSNAVCCSDHIHCCPHGYTCNLGSGTCSLNSLETPFLPVIETKPIEEKSVICPGGTSSCPDSNTCCPLASGGYGCCPLSNAVCCSDHIHCCPHGYTCNLGSGTCSLNSLVIPFLPVIETKPIEEKSVICPGGASSCPDSNTCCPLASGGYGCCPLDNAVCCSDHIHCCPHGYTCNLGSGTCSLNSLETPFLPVIETKPIEEKSVICPGGTSSCPDSNTCCALASGGYGCCPLNNAVCCSDHIHCCPHGYTCNVGSGTCSLNSLVTPFLPVIETKPIEEKSVICPGGTSSCPDSNTCCALASGGYGCCPLSNAVCCSDHIHCCPHGYTCNVGSGTCSLNSLVTPFLPVIETKPIEEKSVICPGGTSSCPDSNTCCALASGGYGCCPLNNAVCCSDHIHCCPHGYTCNLGSGTCSLNSLVIPFLPVIETKPIEEKSVICPGGASSCPDSNTCCPLASGGYGCCPLDNAVCCSDHIHCCPHGYTCNLGSGTCSLNSLVIPFLPVIETKPIEEKSVICPGGASSCPDSNTCCPLASGGYGCCPLDNAVCCSDHIHCCPHGYTCNLGSGTCSLNSLETPFLPVIETKPIEEKSVICPGGTSSCPDSNTCCALASGGYGCCPLNNAVCCSDHIHCCPHGYTCNVGSGTCSLNSLVTPFLPVIETKPIEEKSVICPGGASSCPDSNTCCALASGGYGCCPLNNAVCCSDHIHCCPHGYTCNLGSGTCSLNSLVIPFLPVIETKPIEEKSVICPGGASSCPDSNTCCPLASGGYGCCPLDNAVCCSDHIHCCPHGYTCNLGSGTCSLNSLETPFLPVIETKPIEEKSVICPGGTSSCPDSNTCCALASGGYGCCPLNNAVCCSDHIHCCPHGYTCNVGSGTCSLNSLVTPFLPVIETKPIEEKSVICPGGASSCPDSNTCCALASGGYGCCPLNNAVCCSDHIHCCPHGYTCNVGSGTCSLNSLVTPFLPVIETKPIEEKSVICPGGASSCPDSNTCCPLASGGYGCCPLNNAVCCSDHIHCCPHGYTCNVGSGTCSLNSLVTPFLPVIETKPIEEKSVICPGGASSCPDSNTCCALASGGYGCCPLNNAVCCSDHIHCCPHGYTCNVGSGTCSLNSLVTPFLPVIETKPIEEKSVICPGGASSCPDSNTCCALASGGYGCCPLNNAVCCSDHIHCCPHGYTCNVGSGTCSLNSLETSFVPFIEGASAVNPYLIMQKDVVSINKHQNDGQGVL